MAMVWWQQRKRKFDYWGNNIVDNLFPTNQYLELIIQFKTIPSTSLNSTFDNSFFIFRIWTNDIHTSSKWPIKYAVGHKSLSISSLGFFDIPISRGYINAASLKWSKTKRPVIIRLQTFNCWPIRTRTLNDWTKTSCVTNYTIGHPIFYADANVKQKHFRCSPLREKIQQNSSVLTSSESFRPLTPYLQYKKSTVKQILTRYIIPTNLWLRHCFWV